jgi:hypothetical protein
MCDTSKTKYQKVTELYTLIESVSTFIYVSGDEPVYPGTINEFYHFKCLTSMLGGENEKPTKDLRNITRQFQSFHRHRGLLLVLLGPRVYKVDIASGHTQLIYCCSIRVSYTRVAPYIPVVQHWYVPKVHIPKFPKFHKVYKHDYKVADFYKGPSNLCLEGSGGHSKQVQTQVGPNIDFFPA